MKNKINKMRENLHKEMECKKTNYHEIVKTSEKLDELIVKFYEEEYTEKSKNGS